MNNLYFNNKSAFDDFDLVVVNAIDYPFVQEIIDKVDIEGNRNGYLTIKTNEYQDMRISVTFRLIKMDNYKHRMREINLWLTDIENNCLFFDDYREKCYKVKMCNINPIKDLHFKSADFNVEFELFPFVFKNNEYYQTIQNNSEIYYEGDIESEPIIKLQLTDSEQNISLLIGNQEIQLRNVKGTVIINSEKKLITDDAKRSLSKKMVGDFPILTKGKNSVSWSGNISEFSILKNTIYKG